MRFRLRTEKYDPYELKQRLGTGGVQVVVIHTKPGIEIQKEAEALGIDEIIEAEVEVETFYELYDIGHILQCPIMIEFYIPGPLNDGGAAEVAVEGILDRESIVQFIKTN